MNSKTLNKIVTIIIYVLTLFLIVLILHSFFLLINKNYYPNESPRNSIKVSPISGEKVHNVSNMNTIYKVAFKDYAIDKIPSISKSSIIYDDYNKCTDSTSYSALFLDDNFIRDDSMLTISNISVKDLPKITFVDSSKLKEYSYSKLIDSILLNNTHSYSNFLYYGGAYHHFTKSLEDKDPISNKSITYQNIVVDVSKKKENTLYVYSAGMFREYTNDSNLFLCKGKTFWINLNEDSSISFTFSNLNDRMNTISSSKYQ